MKKKVFFYNLPLKQKNSPLYIKYQTDAANLQQSTKHVTTINKCGES
jgi:hypothetical protein